MHHERQHCHYLILYDCRRIFGKDNQLQKLTARRVYEDNESPTWDMACW